MAARQVSLKQYKLVPGLKVELMADGYRCFGIVYSVELDGANPSLKLTDCREFESGKLEAGVQTFRQSEIEELRIVDSEETSGFEDASSSSAAAVAVTTATRSAFRSKPIMRTGYGDNPHLKKLHSVNMNELLAQVQIHPPPNMEELSQQPGRPRILPTPQQDCEHMEGSQFRDRCIQEMAAVRKIFWADSESPPALKFCPQKLYTITVLKSKEFDAALAELMDQPLVGVSMEGQFLGRNGKLSLLSFSTNKKIFMFDILSLGPVCFDHGLRELLESGQVHKVFHDVRQASDLLQHQYEVSLGNVSDTLVSHALFITWALYAGYLPKYANSYSNLVRTYLGIRGADLFFPHYRASFLKEDTKIWLERPLSPDLEIGAVRNVMYLLDLHRATKQCSLEPNRRATEFLLSYVRDADDPDSEVRAFESHVLPSEFQDCLPNLRPNRYKAERYGVVEDESRQIHNFVGQIDPNLIFSRDCLHQNKKPGSH